MGWLDARDNQKKGLGNQKLQAGCPGDNHGYSFNFGNFGWEEMKLKNNQAFTNISV